MTTLEKEVIRKSKIARVQSTMITFAKMQISYTTSTISIHCHNDWRDGTRKT